MSAKTNEVRAPEGQELVAMALEVPHTAPNVGAVRGVLEGVMVRTGWSRTEVRWAGMLPIEQNRLKEVLGIAR